LAGRYYDGIFISGFSFAASYYGLPDIGFIAWPDIVSFVQRVRAVLPRHHLVVDIDDGYVDTEVAAHVVSLLESTGASAVVMEDQARPRRCGHFSGKQLLELEPYLEKLARVLDTRRDLFVIARTDAAADDERMKRALAFDAAGADAILVDGLENLGLLRELAQAVHRPLMFNQIAGGKSPPCDLDELRELGVSMVNYSTPCLFAAHEGIERAMQDLQRSNGRLPDTRDGGVDVAKCTSLLTGNMTRRDAGGTPVPSEVEVLRRVGSAGRNGA
jgi:2-methylisocitrate lyase-like PEP mutase family enzyme